MTETDEEQQAFPDGILNQDGMTLRDYFAAKAMQSGISNSAVRGSIYECSEMAKFAYDMADAMLKERES